VSDLEKRVEALEKRLAAIEPHVRRSMPIGPCPARQEQIEQQVNEELERIIHGVKPILSPPVDRNARQLTDGSPVTPDHRELKENGQQKDYVVLTPEERAKGFVRPVRTAYIHVGKNPTMYGVALVKAGEGGCGTRTTMNRAIAETYARDPKFYSGTFCCSCGKHLPLDQFVWEGTTEQVGS
jgi:hypothetical protein